MKVLTCAAAALITFGVAAPAAAAQASPGRNTCAWRVMTSPAPGQASLNAVSATSAKDAWAVGSYDLGSGARTLIEHWNGSAWKVARSPDPAGHATETDSLEGVVALSKNNAWAFGSYEKTTTDFRTLIVHWNGSSWSVVKSPDAGPGENVLGAAAAVSPKDIWAVGYQRLDDGVRKTLTEHWNGRSWIIAPSPRPGSASAESLLFGAAASAGRVWAVGTADTASFGRTLAIAWAGGHWSTAATVSPGQGDRFLQAVAAPSKGYALAVGSYLQGNQVRALAERWTGSAWSRVPAASPGADYNSLQAVALRNRSFGWAVGASRTDQGARFTALAERWNGTSWVPVKVPSPGRGDDWLFGAASVPGNGGFFAVGQAGAGTLIEHTC